MCINVLGCFSSAEPKAHKVGGEPASIRVSVCVLTLSNMYISATKRPIATKFYLKHHLGGGKAASGFGSDRIRTLGYHGNRSSHMVIMGKIL